jgi:hypothetical protein
MSNYHHERRKPITVTRGLPYVEGLDYARLVRLKREVDHNVPAYRSLRSRQMVFNQYLKLYAKVYRREDIAHCERCHELAPLTKVERRDGTQRTRLCIYCADIVTLHESWIVTR